MLDSDSGRFWGIFTGNFYLFLEKIKIINCKHYACISTFKHWNQDESSAFVLLIYQDNAQKHTSVNEVAKW